MIGRRTLLVTASAVAGIAALGILGVRGRTRAAAATVGSLAPDVSVDDTKGRTHRLGDSRGKTVVLEWTSPSCPFVAKHYRSGNMQALQRWAADQGVVWYSVLSTHPSRRDYLTAAEADAFNMQRDAAPAALLLDPDGTLGRAYDARVTPHMFVIDAGGALVYAGAIDDRPSFDPDDIAGARNFVRAALEDIAARRPVAVASTSAYGCAIGYGS